jgi:hypothetical protein
MKEEKEETKKLRNREACCTKEEKTGYGPSACSIKSKKIF